jgi:hypothetical protein
MSALPRSMLSPWPMMAENSAALRASYCVLSLCNLSLCNFDIVALEVFESIRREIRVPHRMRDIPVPQESLDRAGIFLRIGKPESGSVAQHVRVHREW